MIEFVEIDDSSAVEAMLAIWASFPHTAEAVAGKKQQLLKELSESGDNRRLFLGRVDGEAVAMIQIVLKNADNDPDLADGKTVAHLHNLQVRADLQRQGIGTQMMALAEEEARKMGKATITLGVDDTNPGAIRLYRKLGYVNFKTEPGRMPDEKCLLMKKAL